MLKASMLRTINPLDFDKVSTGFYDVEFANGVVRVDKKRLMFSMYLWQLCLDLPVMKEFLVPNKTFAGSDMNNTMSLIVEYVFKTKPMNYQLQYDVSKMIKKAENDLYNDIAYEKYSYLSSINILDLIELQDNEELLAAMDVVDQENSPKAIKDAYSILDGIVASKRFSNNPVVIAARAKAINFNQLQQVLCSRGAVTNIPGDIYKKMIPSSFTEGMRDIYELTIESQGGGAKALSRSTEAIQNSEYFGRLLQLFTMVMKGVVFEDCGTKQRKTWFVNKEDLPALLGKEYTCPIDGTTKNIKITDTHLDGMKIVYRDASCCEYHIKDKLCYKCMGELSYSIMQHSNLGFISSAVPTLKVSQNNLSTKHLTRSAVAMEFLLRDEVARYLRVKDNALSVKPEHKTKKMEIWLRTEDCYLIKDLTEANVNSMPIERVAAISEIIFKVTIKGEDQVEVVPVGASSNKGRLTRGLLRHMVGGNYRLEGDYYIVDITNFGTTPLIELNEKEFDYALLGAALKTLFTTMGANRSNKGEVTPDEFLTQLFTLVNSKLTINIALLEILVYIFTARNLETGDYDLSRNSTAKPKLVGMNDLISNRSPGAWISYNSVARRLIDPRIFMRRETTTNPQDYLLVPELMLNKTHTPPTLKNVSKAVKV